MKLQMIAIEDGDLTLAEVIAMMKSRVAIITKKGKPVLQITNVAGGDPECLALANDPKFMKKLADSERSYFREGGVSSEQVLKEVALSPKKSKRRRPVPSASGMRSRRATAAVSR